MVRVARGVRHTQSRAVPTQTTYNSGGVALLRHLPAAAVRLSDDVAHGSRGRIMGRVLDHRQHVGPVGTGADRAALHPASKLWYLFLMHTSNALRSFDSSVVPLSARLSGWQRMVADVLVPLRISARSQTIDGRIEELRSGQVRVTRLVSSAHTATRAPEHVGAHQVKLLLPLRGTLTFRQGGHVATLIPGEIVVCSTSTSYDVGSNGVWDCAVALLPGDLAPDLEPRVVVGSSPVFDRVAASELRRQLLAPRESEPDLEYIADRLRVLLSREVHPWMPATGEGLYDEAIELIEQRLSSPRLSPQYIATVLGVSERTLYSAFAGHRRSVAATIRSLRLERARDLLCHDDWASASVTEIMSEVGFTDAPHFSRVFRDEFGVQPSAMRRRDRLG